jgi:hypothetical protein
LYVTIRGIMCEVAHFLSQMFSIPAIALSTSVACRSFVRLSEFASPVDRSNSSAPWSAANTRITGNRSGKDIGKTSTIQWARPQTETMGISVTRSQHVDVDSIGLEPYSQHNIHPLENTSGDSLDHKDRKAAYAV